MLLRYWLRRAGCVSQDAYILHTLAQDHEKQVQWRKEENVISFLKFVVKNLVAASNVQQVNKNTIAGLHQTAIAMAACCGP